VTAAAFFKNHWFGVFLSSLLASLLAAFVYDHWSNRALLEKLQGHVERTVHNADPLAGDSTTPPPRTPEPTAGSASPNPSRFRATTPSTQPSSDAQIVETATPSRPVGGLEGAGVEQKPSVESQPPPVTSRSQTEVAGATSIAKPPELPETSNYAIRAFNCDDGGRAFVNDSLAAEVGFGNDSGWVDVSRFVRHGANHIKFQVVNEIGAITYGFEVRRGATILFDATCGEHHRYGCEGNRNFPVGVARELFFDFTEP
jgi:hypothetical protein